MVHVNAQTWLNGKFPNQEAKNKVNQLFIYLQNGTDNNGGQNYCFYNTQLEGELNLSDFVNLNYCLINGSSNHHKLSSLKLNNCSKLNNFYLQYNDGQLSVG